MLVFSSSYEIFSVFCTQEIFRSQSKHIEHINFLKFNI